MSAAPVVTTGGASVGSVLWGVAAVGAAAVVAVVGQVAGIRIAVSGTPIAPSGVAVTTVVFAVVGLGIAVVLRRFAGGPRSARIRTAVALTVLSLVPDVLADAETSTQALLMATHLVAAAIVIPAVARRLRA